MVSEEHGRGPGRGSGVVGRVGGWSELGRGATEYSRGLPIWPPLAKTCDRAATAGGSGWGAGALLPRRPAEVALDEGIDAAVEHRLGVAHLDVGAVVLD